MQSPSELFDVLKFVADLDKNRSTSEGSYRRTTLWPNWNGKDLAKLYVNVMGEVYFIKNGTRVVEVEHWSAVFTESYSVDDFKADLKDMHELLDKHAGV